jgi:hypothetical protein
MTYQYESDSQPLPPDMEVNGEVYILTWHDRNVRMTIDRFHTRQEVTSAEIKVEFADRPENESMITRGRAGLLSTFKSLIDECVEFGGDWIEQGDWKIMFKQMSIKVLDQYRMGEPVLNLAELEDKGQKPYIVSPFVYEGSPTIIYGRGGVGKSLFCLYLAMLMQTGNSENRLNATGGNVLYLDWEADPDESKHRADLIAHGMNISPEVNIHYRFCAEPFTSEVDVIRRLVRKLDIQLVVIDSIIPSCGGNAVDPEITSKFFRAIRSLGNSDRQVATLLIGHTTKQEDKSGSPFGSVVWRNGARTVWEFRAPQQSNSDIVDVALVHQKVNLGKVLAPVGFQILWGEGAVKFKAMDARRHPLFRSDMPLGERIHVLLEDNGTMTLERIASSLRGVEENDILDVLEGDNRFETVWGAWQLVSI